MPIPIERLQAIKHIIVHDSCPDGIASAMILKDVLPDAKVSFIQYDDVAHMTIEPEPNTIFCDFSPFYPKQPKDASEDQNAQYRETLADAERKLRGWIEQGCIVLDHHKTQKGIVERFGELGVFADEKAEPGVCGAFLAFREVWQRLCPAGKLSWKTRIEDFATLAGIRDTWQKNDPRWQQACEQAEALFFWPREELVDLPVMDWSSKLSIGPVVFAKKLRAAQGLIDKGWRFTSDKGTRVHVIESLTKTSDAAEILGDEIDWLVGFGLSADKADDGGQHPKLVFSTRSRGTFDCGTFASAHGGGGHTNAAGFKYRGFDPDTTVNPYGLIKQLLNTYEAGD